MGHKFESHPLYPGEGSSVFIAAGVMKEPGQLKPFYTIDDSRLAPLIGIGSGIKIKHPGNATAENPQDFVYYPESGMAGNARGLPGDGVEGLRSFREPIYILSGIGIKTNVSITNLPFETPLEVIPELAEIVAEELRPTSIEINLSCPNGLAEDGSLHPPTCNDPDSVGEILEITRERIGDDVCLGAKDSPHVPSLEAPMDEEAIRRLAPVVMQFCDFVVGINTIGNQPFPEIKCANGKGGMSGPVVASVAREHLATWQEYAPDLAYLSCGGVDSQNAAVEILERRAEGALLVGGAQEFYRAAKPHELAIRWFLEAA